jgi:hypothetical protein
LTYPKQYKAVSNQLRFTLAANTQVSVKDFDAETNVFEVENGRAIRQIKVEMFTENGKFGFGLSADSRDREFVAMTENQASKTRRRIWLQTTTARALSSSLQEVWRQKPNSLRTFAEVKESARKLLK